MKLIHTLFKRGGTLSRKDYSIFIIGTFIILISLILLVWYITITTEYMIIGMIFVRSIWLLLMYIPINLTVKRLHDLGRPGSDYFLLMIPIYGISIVWKLFFEKGKENGNYDDTKTITNKKTIPAIVRVLVVFGGIILIFLHFIFSVISLIE